MTLRVRLTTRFLLLSLFLSLLSSACHRSVEEDLAEAIALTQGLEGAVLSASQPSPYPAKANRESQRLALLREAKRGLRVKTSDPALEGLFRLAVGDYRAAAEILSAEAAARGGKLLNDAAIAHLNLARETNAPLSYLQALDLVDRAVRELNWSPELGYNRALILTKLHLVDLALDAWGRVAEAGDPYWAGLASRRLSELTDHRKSVARMEATARTIEEGKLTVPRLLAEFTAREPYLARIAVEDHLLGRWAEESGDLRSMGVTAETIRTIAEALKQAGQDTLLADEAEVIAKTSGDSVRVAHLRQAHRDYQLARQLYEDQDTKASENLFERAEAGFRDAGSPFVYWATFFRSVCIYYRDVEKANHILTGLEQTVDPGYRALHGRVQWMRGTIDQVKGDVATALKRYFKAHELMQQSSGERGSAFTNVLIATAYDELGDVRRGWWYRMRAFEVVSYTNDHRRIHAMLSEALADLRRQGLARLSLQIAEQLLVNAKRWGKPLGFADGLRQRARAWIQLNEYERAMEDLAAARKPTSNLPESSLKQNILVSLDLAEALAEVGRDPERSTELLDKAFRQQEAAGYLYERLQVCLARSEALKKQGRLEAAEESLHTAAEYFAKAGARADDLETRARAAGLARSVWERILEYELSKDRIDTEKALGIADQMRSQVAADVARRFLSAPTDTSALGERLMRELPDGVMVVMHTTLPTSLLTTVISRGGIRHEVTLVPRDVLTRLVGEFSAGVRLNPRNDRTRELASDLYTKLVQSAGLSAADRRVIFIPDASLGVLPAAAFRNPSTGRFLIEDYEIVNSPTLSLLARMPSRHERAVKRSVLVVGDPTLDPAVSQRLVSLPGALREAETVAGLYDKAILLTGPAATKTGLLGALASSTILHFAGHVEVKQDSFVETAFHLAVDGADPHSDSRVTLNDLSEARMEQLDLAVLSGCDTAKAVGANREDLGGLAAVFLARGVRNVLATIAPVSDARAPEFMRAFHNRIVAGVAPPAAYRESILDEIGRNKEEAPQWVNYVFFGGRNDGI